MRISFWVKVALFNFLIAALMGLLLRAAFVWEIGWMDYRNMLHGHSHVAMLGWIFMALYALLIASFVPKIKQHSPYYRWLFLLTQCSVIGMMIAFPIQGYDTVSIFFSTLNLILSYFFVVRLWRDSRKSKTSATFLMRLSLIGMLISTIGLWGMAFVMALKMGNTEWYFLVIQFYLHFQFNAWFILAALAVFLQYLIKHQNVILPPGLIKRFSIGYAAAVFLTFFHVIHWAYGESYMYALNAIGVSLQFLSLLYLLISLYRKRIVNLRKPQSSWAILVPIALFSWLFKGFIQLFLIVPEMTEISTVIRNFMIGYIHLINLAIVSTLLFFLLHKIVEKLSLGSGMYFFIFGIVSTELYLFLQGLFYWQGWGLIPGYHLTIFLLSIPLPLAVLLVLFRMFKNNWTFLS